MAALSLILGACALDDDPGTAALVREDARCRRLGAMPQTQLYWDCRRAAFIDRDAIYDHRLIKDQERSDAKQARKLARQKARADARAAKAAARQQQQAAPNP